MSKKPLFLKDCDTVYDICLWCDYKKQKYLAEKTGGHIALQVLKGKDMHNFKQYAKTFRN